MRHCVARIYHTWYMPGTRGTWYEMYYMLRDDERDPIYNGKVAFVAVQAPPAPAWCVRVEYAAH